MEQWVFVLPGADDQSECTFFANPSIAGYHVDDGTDIQLTVTFRDEKGDHVYDVVLTKTARKTGMPVRRMTLQQEHGRKTTKSRRR